MALWAIGDLHLSLGGNKPMDVFGGRWVGYVEKLREGCRSSAGGYDGAARRCVVGAGAGAGGSDFSFMSAIPGRKIILKGNHDYWWSTAAKFNRFCAERGYADMHVLNNNCFFYGEAALCGTRGWFYEEDKQGTHDEKVFRRELGRLETSLKAAGEHEKLCFLHYPPKYHGYECPEILTLLQRYGVRACYYGHLHAESLRLAFLGRCGEIDFRCVSADYVNFKPEKVMD